MAYNVALGFEDGVTRFITVDDGQTVADASYRQRINIPLDCRDGACGTCKARCESGEYDGGFYVDDALTEEEAAQGYCLPCSMTPKSDLVLQINSTSAVAKTSAAQFAGTVAALDRLSPTTMRLRLDVENREKLAFLPGQYVNIAVPGTDAERSYSFSSHPEDEQVEFLIKLTAGGVMSSWLTERAQVGDDVTFTGPLGSFFLRESDRPALLIAGGTGLAPMLSMLRLLQRSGSGRTVHLVYGVSSDDDLVELDLLDEFAATMPTFSTLHCVSDASSSCERIGYVTDHLATDVVNQDDLAVYLCGPPPMVEAVRTSLEERHVEPAGFFFEKFASAVQPAASAEPSQPTKSSEPSEPPEPRTRASDDASDRAIDRESEGAATAGDPAPDTAAPPAPPASAPGRTGRPTTPALPWDGVVPVGGDIMTNPTARTIAGQEMFAASDITALNPDTAATPGGSPSGMPAYEVGEEHPDITRSDALFEARTALELGAVDLTLGRLSAQQLSGWRLLAEAAAVHVHDETFLDAAAYTEANAAFHEYLLSLTGNEHLVTAYRQLGVKGHMEETLRQAAWCHAECASDHFALIDAVEKGDREQARAIVRAHGEHSKETTRQAMNESAATQRPAFVTPGRFTGKVVVVTGAGQGIGEAVARRVHAEGGSLVAVDRSQYAAELAEQLTRTPGGPKAIAVNADLETYDGAAAMVDAALTEFGRVDVLVNNVGGAISFQPFEQFSPDQIQAEITRSLMTTLWCCRAVLPQMQTQGGGVIVNVSSVATRGIHRIPYSAAKGGVNALTASLAMECADAGIRVVATAPGGTQAPPRKVSRGGKAPSTPQEQAWFDAHIEQTLDSCLLGRYGTLDEQAAAITFLASDEASYINGTVLPVGGGDLG